MVNFTLNGNPASRDVPALSLRQRLNQWMVERDVIVWRKKRVTGGKYRIIYVVSQFRIPSLYIKYSL